MRSVYHGERFNSITHLVGTILAIAGTAVLIPIAVRNGGTRAIVALSVYGAMLIVMYLSSTLYHSVRGPAKKVFHVFDHCAIYLLIAGTYTPFMIGDLRGNWGWSLFGVIWALAVMGIVFKVFYAGRLRALSTVVYVAMGWLVVIAIGPMVHHLSVRTLAWLVAGGIAYTAGTPFYHWKRVRFSHAIWHAFVLLGSLCHALAVGAAV